MVDEDPGLRRLLRRVLMSAGYQVLDLEPSHDALGSAVRGTCDLLILDIDPIGGLGQTAIKAVRGLSQVPIVALSARDSEDAIVEALNGGADDYVLKPFGAKELLARVNSALRRRARELGRVANVVAGALEIDLLHRRVYVAGSERHLPPKLYEVLRILAEDAGHVITHDRILRAVWGPTDNHREYLRNAVRDLRTRVEQEPARPRYILTEPRVGYRLNVSPGDGYNSGSRLAEEHDAQDEEPRQQQHARERDETEKVRHPHAAVRGDRTNH